MLTLCVTFRHGRVKGFLRVVISVDEGFFDGSNKKWVVNKPQTKSLIKEYIHTSYTVGL